MQTRWILGTLLCAMPVAAQETAKPEVMLFIDTSRDMNQLLNGQPPVCSPDGTETPEPIAYLADTAMSLVQQALAGEVRTFGGKPHWCVAQDAAARQQHLMGPDGAWAHYRTRCCTSASGGACASWDYCGEDHGKAAGHRDAVSQAVGAANSWTPNGTLSRFAEDVKFSFFASDAAVDPGQDAQGLYSYGDEAIRGPNGQQVNLGVRRDGIWNGGLIKANTGEMIGENPDWVGAVGEDPASVRRHNELVAWQARRAVPYGGAPLSAMLRDGLQYLRGQEDTDTNFQCRQRVAVVVTRGRELAAYGGQACPCDANSQCVNGRCEYPVGYPYESAETYATQLRNQGVPVHVIALDAAGGVGDLRARAIATAGSPTEGPAGGPGAYVVSDLPSLRAALDRVTRSAMGGLRSQTRPLAISATPADYCPNNQFPCARPANAVVQWRLNSFSEVDAGGIYGRLQATEMSCGVGGLENGRPKAPHPTVTPKLYEEVLASQNGPRRTLSTNPLAANALFAVTGAAQAMFNDFGGLGNVLNVAQVQNLTGAAADPNLAGAEGVNLLPAREPAGQYAMGLKLNGYFGDRGLPDDPAQARRQLGGILRGDLVALQAPSLGLSVPAYLTYEQAQRQRLTLVASGARDGMIHIFRATDGREVLNIVPRSAWSTMAQAETPMDGPLDVADVVPCRSLGENGPADCPSAPENWAFQAWLVGGAGEGGANLFGVNVTRIGALANDLNRELDPAADIGVGGMWDTLPDDLANAQVPPPALGLAVSRPVLTHVRVNDQVRAAVIAGCGDDPFEASGALPQSDGPGRCVVVLDASTGAVIRKFSFRDDFAMNYPFTGSPVVYPAGSIAPASQAYVGDRAGRLWRIDLRNADPASWSLSIAWPPLQGGEVDEDKAGGYELGREIVDRPSLSLRPDGGLVVIFGTGERAILGGTPKSYVVSFTDRAAVDADGDVSFQVDKNWVMEQAADERMTGPAIVRSETAYFTTREQVQNQGCAAARGRLYGVHAYFPYVNADGEPSTFQASGGRRLAVLPGLTQFGGDGEPLGQKALSIILPPGRVAHGLAITRTPSCVEGEAASTDLILNLSDESGGGQAGIQGEAGGRASKVEVVENEAVREQPLQGRVFARGQGVELDICLDCKPDGSAAPGVAGSERAPFPTEVMYWGSTFLN